MERNRANLSSKFREILGSNNVYFQPPEGQKMHYPCIIYKLDGNDVDHADNRIFQEKKRYAITVIDYDPDSKIYEQILYAFKCCSFDRTAVSDNLNHWYLTLYW